MIFVAASIAIANWYVIVARWLPALLAVAVSLLSPANIAAVGGYVAISWRLSARANPGVTSSAEIIAWP
ncbi:hypothetical protein DF219_09340 [Corynebacterium liangguodongii]|nr:hypothetical protein DF219_09340 [Corynebacterium liangguodongii]